MRGQNHLPYARRIGAYMWMKANFRRTNVDTKLKLTYVKDTYLNVSRITLNTCYGLILFSLQVQIHYKACKLIVF